jgi:hypothetical protein
MVLSPNDPNRTRIKRIRRILTDQVFDKYGSIQSAKPVPRQRDPLNPHPVLFQWNTDWTDQADFSGSGFLL